MPGSSGSRLLAMPGKSPPNACSGQAMSTAPSAPPVEAVVPPQSAQAFSGINTGSPRAPPVGLADTQADSARIRQGLINFGVPYGVARLVGDEDKQIALRIFVLDNSGSTCSVDGKYLDPEASGGRMQMQTCTRWEEIRRMAIQQAAMNASMGTPAEFMLLNPPMQRGFAEFHEGVDLVTVDATKGDVQAQQKCLEQVLRNTRPSGATPLGERLNEVAQRIRTKYNTLAARGLRIVVVVATDGLPTSSGSNLPSDAAKREVVETLRQLTCQLPVFVVVRLTTDDDNVVEFYNKIDEEEELALEVIDDLESEAKEISDKGNGWLTYSPMIHMIREGGTFVKLFDTLDERQLRPLEVQILASHLLQSDENEAQFPSNVSDFCRVASTQLHGMTNVYDALNRRMAPCIDERQLRRAVGVGILAELCRCFAPRQTVNEKTPLVLSEH